MKQSSFALLMGLVCCASPAIAANATTPVDYTHRNSSVAPGKGNAVTPAKQAPQPNTTLQDRRVEKSLVDKTTSTLGDDRAAIAVEEIREKLVREKSSQRPEKVEQPTSALNQKPARLTTNAEIRKPTTVTKYQESLAAASASNMARFPALDGATAAKINRFVFRKNPTETVATDGTSVTLAAGGANVQK